MGTKSFDLQGIKFVPVNIEDALLEVVKRIQKKGGDYFCLVNIHVVMESHRNPKFKNILNNSASNFADGMGVAWTLKFFGNKFKDRVRGTDLMLSLCAYASEKNHKIFLYGNTEGTIDALKKKLTALFPKIDIVGAISPPFRALTEAEDEQFVNQINEANPDILFVSRGSETREMDGRT